MSDFRMTKAQIEKYLPEPALIADPNHSTTPLAVWTDTVVKQTIESNPKLKSEIDRRRNKERKRLEQALKRQKEADEFLAAFSPEDLLEQGKGLRRKFYLHVGPTNSGKTYAALEALKKAESGVYLGPLRLLALEVFETLNYEEVWCDLLTGEEYEEIPNAGITASTIELAEFDKLYDIAVIDEAQLIADPYRGAAWTNAICLIDAVEVHVCLAPEALELICGMLERMKTPYEIIEHERLVPLEFTGVFKDIKNVQPGDALITFSRKKVLAIAAALEKKGIKASVIYGALPPASRRSEVHRFASRETGVVVATDAIGMGISLPIKRIIFTETEKFDGFERRLLSSSEIKQVAGRAGRFGKYDLGEVLTMDNKSYVKECLEADTPAIRKLQIAFPKEALEYDYPLDKLLKQWDELPEDELYQRTDMHSAEKLLAALGPRAASFPRPLLYELITCPVDERNDELIQYWIRCCESIARNEPIPKPQYPESDLMFCELKYQAYDIYHQIQRRIGIEDDCLNDKERLCNKINKFLVHEKRHYLRRCKSCGVELPISAKFNYCEKCYAERRFYRGR